MTLTISPKRVGVALAIGAAYLLIAHLAGWAYAVATPGPQNWRMFNLDFEANIPTWYSTSLLLLCSIALVATSSAVRGRERFAGYWLALAVTFAYLSADEAFSLHEQIVSPAVRSLLSLPAPIRKRAWVFAGAVVVVAFFLVYRRFLRALPAPTRRRFALAGSMYVTGAVVLEFIGGAANYELGGKASILYQLTAMGEEGLEMFGAVLFLYAVLSYLSAEDGKVRITLAAPANDGPR